MLFRSWFIGFTPDLSVAIWGGNDKNKAINSKWVTGGAIVARIWKIFCEEYYKDKDIAPGTFPLEPKMKIVLVDPLTGLLATPYTANPIKKLFVPGTEPGEYAPIPAGAKKFTPFRKLLYGPFLRKDRFDENWFKEETSRALQEQNNTNQEENIDLGKEFKQEDSGTVTEGNKPQETLVTDSEKPEVTVINTSSDNLPKNKTRRLRLRERKKSVQNTEETSDDEQGP